MDNATPNANVAPDTTPVAQTTPQFSQDVQDLMSKKGWKTVDDLATGYRNIEKFSGSPADRQVIWPKDEKDEAGWNSIYNKLGRPEKVDGYEFKNETGIEIDPESYKAFQALAHKEGISKKTFNSLMNEHLKVFQSLDAKSKEMKAQEFEKCDKALKDKWKENWENNTGKALKMADQLKVKELLTKKGLDNDPEIIEMLYSIASMTDESGIPEPNTPAAKDPQAELNEILKSEAFTKADHPEHMKVMERYWRLSGINVTVRS